MNFISPKLINQALLCILILGFCFALTGTSVAQDCTPGTFSVTNPTSMSCRPYSTSLFNKPLPNAGSGGPMTHLAPNSDAIAQNTLGPGFTYVATPGSADTTANPFYYGRSSDPIYKVDSCAAPGNDPAHNPTGTFWHIPNGARFSGLNGDRFFSVWDQSTNKVFSAYHYAMPGVTLPACSATTQQTACSFPNVTYCSMADYATDKGYQAGNGGGDSLWEAPAALMIRQDEWISGTINHALYLNGSCEAVGTSVFPAGSGHAAQCSNPAGPKPLHGSLYFMDYSDAQIASMNIPAWKKTIIKAMAHYGGYFGDTNDNGITQGTYPTRYEGGEAYLTAGTTSPLFGWLAGQGITPHGDGTSQDYSLSYWSGIPNLAGPNCPGSTCDVAHHTHIADQCVPLGLAGQAGGCVDAATNALPSAPTSLTATVQ